MPLSLMQAMIDTCWSVNYLWPSTRNQYQLMNWIAEGLPDSLSLNSVIFRNYSSVMMLPNVGFMANAT